jgi:ribonucleases P/MRP protein subunit RPP40
VQAWRPYVKKDMELMERVQRRVAKLVPSMRKYSYEERFKFFNLTTLESRRIRGDLIEVFKVLRRYEDVNAQRCNLDFRKYTFAHRIVEIWNSLDEDTVASDSLNGFKSRISKILQSRGFILALDLRFPSLLFQLACVKLCCTIYMPKWMSAQMNSGVVSNHLAL